MSTKPVTPLRRSLLNITLYAFIALEFIAIAWANEPRYSSNLFGPLGLNTVPNARMAETGSVKIGISTLDPYVHGYLGFQIADPLYINIRQSAEVSNINKDPDRLYPGVDIKLRLVKESRVRPDISLGLQSTVGHKRMAGEYLVLSKRYHDFDFTAGIGWGRYGSAGHFKNPLKGLHKHFSKNRSFDGEMPNRPHNWFTGETAGLFGGVEYFTPVEGLSFKLDWGADRYEAEQTAFNFQAPAPWSAGLSYTPANWANLSLAMQGTDKIMGRISLQNMLVNWRDQGAQKQPSYPMHPFRSDLAFPGQMKYSAARETLLLYDTNTDLKSAKTNLALKPHIPAPYQLGRTAVHMGNHAGSAIEEFVVTPTVMGLQGPAIRLMRSDFERAVARNNGSPEEIWLNTAFQTTGKDSFVKLKRLAENDYGVKDFFLSLDNHLSLSEEDNGTLYRSSLRAGSRGPSFFGFLDSGYALRLNIKDNLHKITDIRPRALLPVRSDIDLFAKRTLGLDESWLALTHSFKTDLHLSLIGGYLEEMYGGFGGELLYRPFKSRFALGTEAWQVFKRDPNTELNLGFNGDHLLSGHVNVWYDIPHHDITLKLRAGRYLAEDVGGALSLIKRFKNGANLEGFLTVSDQSDFDLFGGTTHAYHGIRLNLPLNGYKFVPQDVSTALRIKAAPFGRDIGQSIEKPLDLYELTEPFSYSHMATHWDRIVP